MTRRSRTPPPVVPDTFIRRDSALARVARPFAQFLRVEAGGGIVLVAASIAALVWANSPWDASYMSLWETRVRVDVASLSFDEDLLHVINDGLMAVFFFVVGLEIKRELVTGELRDRRQAALPVVAAVGGMVVPAAIYLAINASGPAARGWGIPMATDIAFALGVVAVLGTRVPSALKIFLLALAIVDDIGAIAIIAIFYSDEVRLSYVFVACGLVVVVGALRRIRVTYPPIYVAVGFALWLVVYESGIHATIAGVAMGLLAPATPLQTAPEAEAVVDALEGRGELSAEDVHATAFAIRQSVSVCERLVELLHPWTSYVIVPLFALANAGVVLRADALGDSTSVFVGVLVGLVVGKCVGVTGFAWLAVQSGVARLPEGVGWMQVVAAATLAGIGFTVSLFITGLAFTDGAEVDAAKAAILVASVVAAVGGAALFTVTARRARR